jgi:hypothetical protein
MFRPLPGVCDNVPLRESKANESVPRLTALPIVNYHGPSANASTPLRAGALAKVWHAYDVTIAVQGEFSVVGF